MLILQVISSSNRWFGMIGIVQSICGNSGISMVNPLGRYGYHPDFPENTRDNFGTFRLELIS